MANKLIYTPVPLQDCHRQKRQCRNCEFEDLFISSREAKAFAESGSRAFKNERGEIIGYVSDHLKTFCSLTGSTVNPKYMSVCEKHIWSKIIWAGPTDELTVC